MYTGQVPKAGTGNYFNLGADLPLACPLPASASRSPSKQIVSKVALKTPARDFKLELHLQLSSMEDYG